MSDSEELDDKLYDLFLLGLYWRLGFGSRGSLTTAYPVVAALSQVACYRDVVHRKLTNRTGLIGRVQLHAKVARRAAYAVASRLEVAAELAAVVDEHLIMLVCPQRAQPTRTDFDHSRVLGSKGYPLLLTAKGVEVAVGLTERYPLLDQQQYLAGQARFNTLRPSQKRNL